MTSVLASLILTQTPLPVPAAAAPTMTFAGGFFNITDSTGKTKVNTKHWAKPHPTTFELKTGKAVLKWDWKGFTVAAGKTVRTTRLIELPVSARFFSPEQIALVGTQIAAGEWKKEVTGLSGWEQIGSILYLVPRWESKAKKTWLEMLIKVDLSKASPWFEVIGEMEGRSKANAVIEDRLFKSENFLAMVSEKEGDWGVSLWPIGGATGEFKPIGIHPRLFDINDDGSVLRFIETTSYGTYLAGAATLPAGNRADLAESRDPLFFPGDTPDIVQINAKSGVVLRNTESGLELRLPANVGVRNVAPGVLVWVPRESPTQAVLYSKSGLRAIARWKATPAAKPTPPARRP